MDAGFVPNGRYERLIDVDSTKGNGVYQVRVLRRWKVVDSTSPVTIGSVKLFLIDIHGIKIHAEIPKDILHLFDEKIVEGGVCCISFVDVKFNVGSLIPTFHRYKFVFTEATVVAGSTNSFIPDTGFSLIRAKDIRKNRDSFKYMIDVIGVVTAVNHDKDFFLDGTVRESVTFRLNHVRKSFLYEFTGKLVSEFVIAIGPSSDGLPIVVLQFVKLGTSQGSALVEGIEGVTRIFVNPMIDDVLNFRKSLVQNLIARFDYSGLYRPSLPTPVTIPMDFLKDFPVRTVGELISNSGVGYFIVNARIINVVDFDPWWYAMCDCPRFFREYIGDFKCVKCQAPKWTASPKVRLTFEVDDETGTTLFRAFDNVMVNVAAVNLTSQGISFDTFYDAFKDVLGKSMMFIVRKNMHETNFVGATFDIIRVADSQSIINYFIRKGNCVVPSKVIEDRVTMSGMEVAAVGTDDGTRRLKDLIKEYQFELIQAITWYGCCIFLSS